MDNIFLKWLFLKPNKNLQISNIEICNHLFKTINHWVNNTEDISFYIPEDVIIIHFYFFIYHIDNKVPVNYNSNYDELFNNKYHSEIIDIYLELKDICNSYTVNILNKPEITANNLMDFLNYYIDISEELYSEENDILFNDNEIYIDYE